MKKAYQDAYPVSVADLGRIKLPRLGGKKMALITKDPYRIKPVKYLDEATLKKNVLDGFFLLNANQSELPHELIKVDVSSIHSSFP